VVYILCKLLLRTLLQSVSAAFCLMCSREHTKDSALHCGSNKGGVVLNLLHSVIHSGRDRAYKSELCK